MKEGFILEHAKSASIVYPERKMFDFCGPAHESSTYLFCG